MKEIEIVRKIKQGDSMAFTLLYDYYLPKVHNYSKLYINKDDEAMDIAQEVFVKVWESRNSLDEYRSMNGFLFITTRNIIINHIRKCINEATFKKVTYHSMEDSYNMEEDLEANNLEEYIDELVASLPPRRKKVFCMSRKDNLSYREIAMHCDISEKAVERHIHLALKFIRKNIAVR